MLHFFILQPLLQKGFAEREEMANRRTCETLGLQPFLHGKGSRNQENGRGGIEGNAIPIFLASQKVEMIGLLTILKGIAS
jgi:hypothetical protein